MFTHLDYILWFLAAALDLSVFALMLYGNQYRRFPIFTSYLGWKLALHASNAIAMQHGAWAYFYTYWITTLINVLAGGAALFEVYELKRKHFQKSLLFFLSLALATVLFTPANTPNLLMAGVRTGERTLFIVSCGLFAYAVCVKPLFGRQRFGIALGFGLFSSVSLAKAAILSHSQLGVSVIRVLPVIAYCLAALCWLVLLRKQEFSRMPLSKSSLLDVSEQLTTNRMALNSYMNSST